MPLSDARQRQYTSSFWMCTIIGTFPSMPAQKTPMRARWSQDRRLRFIDFRLSWEGVLNRQDLHDQFGISSQQASLDLREYIDRVPHNIEYDRKAKVYRATSEFKPLFSSSGAPQYLTQLFALNAGLVSQEESPLQFRPHVEMVPLPTRAVRADVLRWVVAAVRAGQSLDVDYQSIAREEPQRRVITPHAFAQDGLRWHARAFCSIRNDYKDFVLGRILMVHGMVRTPVGLPDDTEWKTVLTIVLRPHPELHKSVQEGVAIDFAMRDGSTEIPCRQAMLFYMFKSLGLSPRGRPVRGQLQVEVANLAELEPYLPEPGQPARRRPS